MLEARAFCHWLKIWRVPCLRIRVQVALIVPDLSVRKEEVHSLY